MATGSDACVVVSTVVCADEDGRSCADSREQPAATHHVRRIIAARHAPRQADDRTSGRDGW
jgi:hypothetical protein